MIEVASETNFLDEKSKKVVFGLLKSPIVKIMLRKSKKETVGVSMSELNLDSDGIHFTLNDDKTQKQRKVIITKQDLEQIIRFVME